MAKDKDGNDIATLTEIKELISEQGDVFEKFKEANDERLEQIEKTGAADPLQIEKTDKLSAEVGEAADAVTKMADAIKAADDRAEAEKTAREAFEKVSMDRMGGIETRMARPGLWKDDDGDGKIEIKHVVELLTGDKAEPITVEVAKERAQDYEDYVAAFKHYMRRSNDKYGHDLDEPMRKALSVGIEADGGYWVIPEISNQVKMRLFDTSPMRDICQVISISTDAIEFPTDTNDAVTGGWVGETADRDETNTPQTGTQRISVHEQYANPRATQKLLDDAAFPAETWLANKIGDKFGRDENLAFVSGNGVARPRGFTDYGAAAVNATDASGRAWGVLQYIPTTDATGFAGTDPSDDLLNLVYSLNPAYRTNARWVSSRAVINVVRQFKDGDGRYIWAQGIGVDSLQPSTLLGFPITEAEDMAALAADSFSMAFGDFREGYMIVDRQGIRTLRDPFTAKPYIQFYTTKRVGGDVVNFDAIKLMKTATT